jgi:hypothetical protein
MFSMRAWLFHNIAGDLEYIRSTTGESYSHDERVRIKIQERYEIDTDDIDLFTFTLDVLELVSLRCRTNLLRNSFQRLFENTTSLLQLLLSNRERWDKSYDIKHGGTQQQHIPL